MATGAKGEIKVCDGNVAAAYGVLLAKVDVVSAFPVTPQTALVENLSRFVAEGMLDAEMVNVEGETSAMGVVVGACLSGARVFTASSGAGLDFMYDGLIMVGRMGAPVVMVVVMREDPPGVRAGEQDVMDKLDISWIQLHTENCQEILDTIIMAYKLAEDPEILLPVMVCYDGFYLSYLSEAIEIPQQEKILSFAPKLSHLRRRLDLEQPTSFVCNFTTEEITEMRYRQQGCMEKVKDKLDKADEEYGSIFGRTYGGQIEEYRTEDAEILLMALGSCVGTARVAVDQKREQGIKVGLVKVRLFRPFPKEKLTAAALGKKAIGVIDRNVCFGWDCGHLFMELKAALYGSKTDIPLINIIDGLAGADITIEHIERAIDMTYAAAQGNPINEVTWFTLE